MMSFAGSEGGAAAVPETTTKKHRRFVSEPMGDKPVTDLAGIGPAIGGRLIEKGFDKAYVVLGQFLLLKKDRDLFVAWLKKLQPPIESTRTIATTACPIGAMSFCE